MKVKEFVEEFLHEENLMDFINKHIITDYIPYENKINISEKVIKSSFFNSDNDVSVFRKNTPAENALFDLIVVSSYTDIEIDMDNPMAEYNLLVSTGALDSIKKYIPQKDYIRWINLHNSMINDVIDNEKSVAYIIYNTINMLSQLYNTLNNSEQ